MKFNCPHCAQRIEANDAMAGSVVECPTCSLNFTIPQFEKTRINYIPRAILKDDPPISQQAHPARQLDPLPPTVPENEPKNTIINKKRRFSTKRIGLIVLILVIAFVVFRTTCGIFVVQPIGAIPDGGTIIYWRSGMNIPFISSADGLQQQLDGRVSLLGRGLILAGISETLQERKIFSLPYSKALYLWSTGGREYDR